MENIYRHLYEKTVVVDSKNSTKINIHFSIRGDINSYCLKLNKEIIKTSGFQNIDFGYGSIQFPHLTLAMGYIRNQKDLFNLLKAVSKFVNKQTVIPTKFSNPYLVQPNNNYIFLDAEQNETILRIKKELHRYTKNIFNPFKDEVIAAIPHITLGYVEQKDTSLINLLQQYPAPPETILDSIGVSFCGSLGSCVGLIKSFEIKKN